MVTVAHLLAREHPVRTWGAPPGAPQAAASLFDALHGAECVILPLPATRDGLHPTSQEGAGHMPSFSALFSYAPEEALFLGGQIPPALMQEAAAHGLRLLDYYTGDGIVQKNALATAEAAVTMAAAALPVTLRESAALVTGYGRIGRAIVHLLCAHGARVTVYTRSPQGQEEARAAGAEVHAYPLCPDQDTRVVFHTAPAPLWQEEALAALAPGALLYDLAGGGADSAAAARHGIKLPPARGLPGRYAPESAGRYIYEEIGTILQRERGVYLC